MNYKELLNNLNSGYIGRDKWILKRDDLEIEFYKNDVFIFKIEMFKFDIIFNPFSNVTLTGYELSLLIEFSRSTDWLNMTENRSTGCPNIDSYNSRILQYLMEKGLSTEDLSDIMHITREEATHLMVFDIELSKHEYDMIKRQIDEYLDDDRKDSFKNGAKRGIELLTTAIENKNKNELDSLIKERENK